MAERILQLTLKKKWFDMIASGIKKEEYREIKPYWINRLLETKRYPAEQKGEKALIPDGIVYDLKNGHKAEDVFKGYYCDYREYDYILFINGYGKHCPFMKVECKGITAGKPKPEWSDVPEDFQGETYIIKLGRIIAGVGAS